MKKKDNIRISKESEYLAKDQAQEKIKAQLWVLKEEADFPGHSKQGQKALSYCTKSK